MVDIQSKEVIDKVSDELKIQPALNIPRQISKDIQLTYNVNPPFPITIVKKATATSATTTEIFTVPTGKTFYCTNAFCTLNKQGASTNDLNILVQWVENAQTNMILKFTAVTSNSTTNSHPTENYQTHPIKITEGNVINLVTTGTLGGTDISATALIKGFLVDNQ